MWKCELCGKEFDADTMAIDLRLGYVDSEEINSGADPYAAFLPEQGVGPIAMSWSEPLRLDTSG